MRRIDKRLLALNDRLARLADEEGRVRDELGHHQHLHDDAARDAAVSAHPVDREDARLTGSDVARFERRLTDIEAERRKIERKRQRLLDKLD